MSNVCRCIINKDKLFMGYDSIKLTENVEVPTSYKMQDGDILISTLPPIEPFLKHKWDGAKWKMILSAEEVEEARYKHYSSVKLQYPPPPPEPSENDLMLEMILDLDFRQTMTELGI